MKIAIPVFGFTRMGGRRVLANLATEWVNQGHEVYFFAPQSSPPAYYPTKAEIVWLDDAGCSIEWSERIGRRSGWQQVFNALALLKGLNRYAADFDIILANRNLTAWPVAFCQSRARKFYYVQAYEPEHYEGQHSFRKRILKWTAVLTYHLPLERIVNGEVYFNYGQLRADKCIPPGIDLELFHPRPVRHAEPPFVFGCIGRNEPEKGTRFVLEAFDMLVASGLDVKLRVAAFGVLPEKYLNHPDVEIEKPECDEDLAKFYQSLDALVAPGIGQRGAPHYPVIEAMACGVPLVTTGYFPATKENAWIVPEADARAIATALSEIARLPDLAASKVTLAREPVQSLSWERVARNMLNYFNR